MKATKKKIPRSTKQLNAAYAKATPAQRRKMIARDALSQLKAKKFRAKNAVWAKVRDSNWETPNYYEPLQPFLLKQGTTCECCGAGAIFLSYVRLANNAEYRDREGLSSIQRKTDWPIKNLRLIELAFEEGNGHCTAINEKERKAVHFGEDYDDAPTERLNAILKNIVKSKEGLFTP